MNPAVLDLLAGVVLLLGGFLLGGFREFARPGGIYDLNRENADLSNTIVQLSISPDEPYQPCIDHLL